MNGTRITATQGTTTQAGTTIRKRVLRRGVRAVVAPVLALGIAAGALVAVGSPAEAWYAAPSGKAANVTLPTTAFAVSTYGGYTRLFQISTSDRIVAYRSPATTGAQTARVTVHFMKWSGSNWYTTVSKVHSSTIPAGATYTSFPQTTVNPNTGARGYWAVGYVFQWFNASGAQVGTMAVVPTVASEHYCTLRSMGCVPNNGFIYVDNAF